MKSPISEYENKGLKISFLLAFLVSLLFTFSFNIYLKIAAIRFYFCKGPLQPRACNAPGNLSCFLNFSGGSLSLSVSLS
jgi:hypothetical protein